MSIEFIVSLMIMIVSGFTAFVIGYLNRKKFGHLRYFYLYPGLSGIFTTVSFFEGTPLVGYKRYPFLVTSGTTVFMILEFIFIYTFFLSIVKSRMARSVFLTIGVSYFMYACYLVVLVNGLHVYPKYLYLSQSIVILIPTGYYFVQLLKQELAIEMQKDPNFWISLGVLLYFGVTLPLFLLIDIAVDKVGVILSKIYYINNVAYSVLFLIIAKAYRCPKEISKRAVKTETYTD